MTWFVLFDVRFLFETFGFLYEYEFDRLMIVFFAYFRKPLVSICRCVVAQNLYILLEYLMFSFLALYFFLTLHLNFSLIC